MSPEGMTFAIDSYLCSLKKQAGIAQAFYFGKVMEALELIGELPYHIQMRIDQIVWDLSKGEEVHPSDERFLPLMTQAVLLSLEERMGF